MKHKLLILNLLLVILFLGTAIIHSTPKIMRAQIEATPTPIISSFEDHLTPESSESEQVTSLHARSPSTTTLPIKALLPSDANRSTMTLRSSDDEVRVPEGCYEYLDNGGFEYDSAWVFDSYPYAGYSNLYASAGAWSAYLSTYLLGTDQYPWMWQTVTIPANYESITIYFDTMAVAGDAGDTVYIAIYDQSGNPLDFGIVTYSAIGQWSSWTVTPEVDLSGQTIDLTYLIEHDNDQYYSEVNFDEVSMVICEGSTPATSTPRPATSTPPPATSTPQPATSTPPPATSTPQPATSTPQPATSTPRPATSTPQPATSTPPPATSTPQPATSTPPPATSTSTPQPATSTPQPATSTPQPATSTPRPATSTPRPATSTPRPATSTPRPATSTPRPATSTPRPATSTPRPATSTPSVTATVANGAVNRPFPQHVTYASGTIRPTNFSQAEQDQHVRDFYDYWKSRYLVSAGTNGAGKQMYRITFGSSDPTVTVSEGQGYGMVTVALMAGHDPDAQPLFDGLWSFARNYPSGRDSRLMSWKIRNGQVVEGNNNAFDGDVDIAYGLLLADAQWGSNGKINYKAEAEQVIAGILESTIGQNSRLPMLGDWVNDNGSPYNQYTPRSSDFILSHFRAFGRATNDATWETVINNSQAVIDHIQSNHSSVTGLLPDFIINCNPISNCEPPSGQFLESPNDKNYYYNAGRDPWRIGLDALLNGDATSKAEVQKMVSWVNSDSGGDASNIKAGYQLGGTPIGNYFTTFFVAPFGVGAMLDSEQQQFLNDIYASVYNKQENYYEDSINLQTLLVMTGNYWDPTASSSPATPTPRPATRTPTPPPTGSINLTVDRIEISQAIQHTDNSVPLVANRPAIMRLFVEVTNSSSAVNGVTARLHAARNGTELSNSPIAPFNSGGSFSAPLSPSRSRFGDSLNFQLPTSWTSGGQLRLWVEVNPERTVAESNYGDNRSQNQTFTFHNIRPLEVVLIPIAYQRNGTGPVHRPNMNASNNFGLGMLQRIYPIPSIDYTIHPEYIFRGDMSTQAGWSQLLNEIVNLRARELPSRAQWDAAEMPKYYGVLPMEVGQVNGGVGYISGTASIGLVEQDDVAAHEIGHNVGLPHVDCGNPNGPDPNYPYPNGQIGQVGIDVYQRELISASTHQDLMSYCWPKWLSDYNYRKIFDVLAGVRRPAQEQEPQAGWLISGRIYPDGTGSLDNAEPILSSAIVEEPGFGLYDIELLDQSDVVQFRYSFNPVEIASEDETALPSDFAFVVPQLENLGRIQLKQGSSILATLEAAAAPPALSASQSAASNGNPDDVTISWGVGPNPRGPEQIKVNLRYSPDGGESWQTLAVGLTETSLDLTLSQLPASENGLIEVIATNSTQSASRLLELGEIGNKAPQVGILNQGKIQLYQGEPLILEGAAFDLEDGNLTGNNLAWSEATLGQLGTGQTLILTEGLQPGSYTINLTATDSDGDSATDQVTVIVSEGQENGTLYLPIIIK